MIARCNVLVLGLMLISLPVKCATAATVGYLVEFNATWSSQTHSNAYPSGAHFSPLIGGVHNDQASFWNPGGISTVGIERMAELGSTAPLRTEIQSAIDAGSAASVIQGSGILAPGSTSTTFEISTAFPLVTLVTMVAPSPDWFVGVHGLDLRNEWGWIDQLTIDLFAYDAGTDNGVNFTSRDIDASPRQPIALLATPFGSGDPRLGTFTFTRIGVPEPSTFALALFAGVVLLCRRTLR